MPLALAASTKLDLAVPSSLLSVGWATAFSCTVESTITRDNSFLAISLRVTATSMVRASSSSTPSSPRALRKRPSCVGSHGHWCSKYSFPEKYCPVGVSPQLDHVLVALVERMLEVQQRQHQSGGQTRPPGIGDAATGNGRDQAIQVQVFDLLASLNLAHPALGEESLDFLPRHAIGQHRQWVALRSSDPDDCGKSHRSWRYFQKLTEKRLH